MLGGKSGRSPSQMGQKLDLDILPFGLKRVGEPSIGRLRVTLVQVRVLVLQKTVHTSSQNTRVVEEPRASKQLYIVYF